MAALMWTPLSLDLVRAIVPNRVSITNQNGIANSVDPDEEAHYLDLHCLHWYLYRSTALMVTHL